MTPQHIVLAIGFSAFISALAMLYWCEFGKGGLRDLRAELNAEVELNIKLLKMLRDEKYEKNQYFKMLEDHNKSCADFIAQRIVENIKTLGNELAQAFKDMPSSQFSSFRADGAGEGERTSVEQSSARPSSTASDEVSAAVEVENGASAESGPDGARTVSSEKTPGHSSPVCDKVGHVWFGGITGSGASYSCTRCTKRFLLPNPNKTCDETGHLFGEEDCLRCTAKQATSADIEEIRAAHKAAL